MDTVGICRVCRRRDQEMILLFDEKYADEGTTLATMLSMLTIYKVGRFDELPQLICSNCKEAARSAFRFKMECEKSYRLLVGMLKDVNTTANFIKREDYSEKSTQTEDRSLFPCERCEEKFFTFDALKDHRETNHKGSAMECRFCAKSFNRIGYLRTHIAVFHPDMGFTSHNQCCLCHRQFMRRDHLRRHIAVKHKVGEHVDDFPRSDVDESIREQDSSMDNLSDPTKSEGGDLDLENEIFASPIDSAALKEEYMPNVGAEIKKDSSDEEDDAPLSKLLGTLPSNAGEFIEVLLGENVPETDKLSSPPETQTDAIDHIESPPSYQKPEDLLLKSKRGRGRPPRVEKATFSSLSASNKRQFKCGDCDRVFQHRATLQRHMLNHADQKEYACTVCTKRFTRADYLKSHMTKLHDATRKLKCEKCDQEFTHINQYKRHKSKHREKEHSCDICGKSFTTKLYLQRHLNLHSNKRYVCKECAQTFLTKEELNMHIKAAEHDKPMLCPECGLRCKTSNILMVHMRRHKGEKPFKCKFCSKGFPRMDDLRVHEKYHTNEKSHFCETCGKGFQRKYNLTIHLRVHTGERPYKCPHCPQAFAQGNDLKSHIRRHTGERFRCEVCGAAFLQGYQIRQHKLVEHGIKEDPPTQRVAKFTSPEEQEQQIKQIQQRELGNTSTIPPQAAMEQDVHNKTGLAHGEQLNIVTSTTAMITETLHQLIDDM